MSKLQDLLNQADPYRAALKADPNYRINYSLVISKQAFAPYLISQSESEAYPLDKAWRYLSETVIPGTFIISEGFILDLYDCVYSEKLPAYRKNNNCSLTLKMSVPDFEELPRLMEHFSNQVESSKYGLHPVELAAMAHKRFLDIHPFEKGNEAVAYLVMNALLINAGFYPICIPERYINVYISNLDTANKTGDITPLMEIIAECVIDCQKRYA